MTLYEVTITLSSYVAADSSAEAEKAAKANLRDIMYQEDDFAEFNAQKVHPNADLPEDVLDSYAWTEDKIEALLVRDVLELNKVQASVAEATAEQYKRNTKLKGIL